MRTSIRTACGACRFWVDTNSKWAVHACSMATYSTSSRLPASLRPWKRRWSVAARSMPLALKTQRAIRWMAGRTTSCTSRRTFPSKTSWSVVIYDNQTRSMLQTDQEWPAVSSQTKGLLVNADGSVDVYFGPNAPAGKGEQLDSNYPWQGLE